MNALFYSSVILFLFVTSINCDTIAWNVPSGSDFSFSKILTSSNQQPVILFLYPNFEIGQFTRQANAYESKNDGGRLKNLKKWIDRSEGYTVSSDDLSKSLLRYFDTTDYDSDNPPAVSDVTVLLVDVQDWDDLDAKADEIRRLFKGKKYISALTTNEEYRYKRAAESDLNTEPPTNYQNFTFLQIDECKLYAKNVYFAVKVTNTSVTPPTTGSCSIMLDQNPIQYDSQCSNFTGTMTFGYTGPMAFDTSDCNGITGTLDSLQYTITLGYNNATTVWLVETIEMIAKGSLIQDGSFDGIIYDRVTKNVSWEVGTIQGAKYFAYACSDPPVALSYPVDKRDSTGKDVAKFQYGLAFKNLILQPFTAVHNVTDQIMTDDIDDCVPFFNIYIWMLIVSGLLLVGIVLCGMGMMGSLKTMDRFDDMRSKMITVNVVN